MDVLGLLSNISQVVDLLVKIGVMCSIYCVDVKKAPQDVRKLLNEVDRLTAVIKELELLLQSPKGSSKLESQSLRQAVFDLRKLLAELVAKLDLGVKHARALWPFRKQEIHEIIAAIGRQKANILLNINIEQTAILLDVHQKIVLSKLRVADAATFDSSTDGEESFCLKGTRNHIITQIREWSTNASSQSIFWLNGMAGTGKSTISRTMAQSFAERNMLGASFFFKRGGGDRGRTSFLITTIAAQLVRRIPSVAPRICKVLDLEPRIHEKPLEDQFQKLILEPLESSPGCWPSNLLIVVDALDECGSDENMRTLVNIFSKAQQRNSPCLKIFLTSRPELPIRLGFEEISGKYDHLLLATVSTPTIEHDIELFMRHQLGAIKSDYNKSVTEHRKISSEWPGADVVQKLVASAVPLFIVAATICRFLKDRRLGSPHHQLKKILEYQKIQIFGLDMTYLPVLDSLIVDLPLSAKQEVMARFRYLIGSIVTLAQPLSIRSLADLLSVSTDIIEDQLDLLHSVLGVPTDLDTPVRLLHLSFRDFLVDSGKKLHLDKYPFWVDESEAHSKLFLQCLKLLSTSGVLKEDICFLKSPGTLRSDMKKNVVNEYLPSAVQYACIYWVYHLNLSSRSICDHDETHNFLASYLLNWLEALGLMGRITESIRMMDDLIHKVEATSAQILKSLLQDTKRFLQANMATIDKAPLQIYSSALIFAPEESIVKCLFKSSIPSWLCTPPVMQPQWDPCLTTLEDYDMKNATIVAIPLSDRFLSILPHRREMKIWDTKAASCIATHKDVLPDSVRVSPDGSEVLYISGDEELQVMDAVTGNCIGSYKGHTSHIICAIFSLDGQQFASASKDGTLRIWDKNFDDSVATYDYTHGTDHIIGFTPDRSAFLVMSSDDTVKILHTRKTCIKRVLTDLHKSRVKSAVISPNSLVLASADNGGTLIFSNITSGATLETKGVDLIGPAELVFLSNGSRLISPVKGHTIGIWNTATARCESLLNGHRASISDIVLSKDESKIASASFDKDIRLWDTFTGACIAVYKGHDKQIASITFSADERFLISADHESNCKIWDLATEIQSAKIEGHDSAILEVVFSPDKQKIATTSGDRVLKLWTATNGECIGTGNDHQLFAWPPLLIPLDMLSAPFDFLINSHGPFGCPRSVNFSSNSSTLVSAATIGEGLDLRLWNATTGRYELLLEGAESFLRSIAFSADDATLSSTMRDGTLRYWDMKSRTLLYTFGDETFGVSSSIHSPDGTHLILACDDGAIRLCQLATKALKKLGDPFARPALLVAASADGTKIAASSLSAVKIWDMDTSACVASYPTTPLRLTSEISQILFSPNNQHLVVLYEWGEVKVDVLDAGTGHCVGRLGICPLANHMEFDSIGSRLITNVGTFAFNPSGTSHNRAILPDDPSSYSGIREPTMIGIGLGNDGEWVTWNSQKILWLPPAYRASAVDVAASTIALGTRVGRLLLIGLDPSAVPNTSLPAAQAPFPALTDTQI
ncbi:hypothetical protein V8C35DRAFT_306054 [Trichoderma chlorosporum]